MLNHEAREVEVTAPSVSTPFLTNILTRIDNNEEARTQKFE